MYLDFAVKIPDVKGKITYRTKGETDYVYYEYDRIYNKKTQKTNPKRATIGKRLRSEPEKMIPNEIYLKYFPDAELPEENGRGNRSNCLKVGAFMVIRKIIRDYHLEEILFHYLDEKNLRLFLDFVAYTIITENNLAQYYPDYAYNHPLFTSDMRIYSASKISLLLSLMTDDQIAKFLNEWNSSRPHRAKIYIYYDATNNYIHVGDLEIGEYGIQEDGDGVHIFHYFIAYDIYNAEPLFYEKYSGNITNITHLKYMIGKAQEYGYYNVGFILDRGYFNQSNIRFMDKNHCSFVIMVKEMNQLVSELIRSRKGMFENKSAEYIDEYEVFGITIQQKICENDEKERYFHIFYDKVKEENERRIIAEDIRRMKEFAKEQVNKEYTFGKAYSHYFYLHYNEENNLFQFLEERSDVIERENDLCGYYCIITSERMTAKDAITLYNSRDSSEKLFCGDKSYLGNRSKCVYSDEYTPAKIFIEFVAMIIRNKMYACLNKAEQSFEEKQNYMTVPSAIRELEKIEMGRQTDNQYRLDHALNGRQGQILKAFGIDLPTVTYWANEIGDQLRSASMNRNMSERKRSISLQTFSRKNQLHCSLGE